MTSQDVAPVTIPPGEPRRWRPVRRQAIIGVLALILIGGSIWCAWWSRHPDVFAAPPDSPSVGLGQQMAVAGAPLHIDMGLRSDDSTDSVTITRARPHVLTNTADAEISLHVCVTTGTEAILSVRGDLSDWCSEVLDVEDVEVPLRRGENEPRYQLIMSISPAHRGDVRVRGLDLTYRHGFQNGTQQTGEHVWINWVRRPLATP